MDKIHKRLAILNKNSLAQLLKNVGLSDKYRNLLYLKYVDELSFKEIATIDTFKNYNTDVLSAMTWKARKELNDIIENQYDLLDDETKSIIDLLNKIKF